MFFLKIVRTNRKFALIGKELGQYLILEALGEGGMASVYKGYDRRLDRDVAIKVILPGFSHSDTFIKRFEREARSIAKLTHTNIVGVIHYGTDEGIPYLVMEYVPGGSLKDLMGKPIPWHQAAQMLASVARALEYAHEKNIIHRDIKPSNLLVTHSKDLMISDFGIAKTIGEDLTKLTATGVGIGTPAYMAPEQGMGKETDHRADIYSLGIVFYEMITGRTPYEADTPFAVIMKHINDPLPRPKEFIPDIPETVERILFKALAKDPEHRYQEMGEFAQALEDMARQKVEQVPYIASDETLLAISEQKEKEASKQFDKISDLMSEAEEALLQKNWEKALRKYREVLKLQPDYVEAQIGFRLVLEEQELSRLYGQALLHQEAGRQEQALRSLQQIQNKNSSYQDVPERIQTIEDIIARQKGKPPVDANSIKASGKREIKLPKSLLRLPKKVLFSVSLGVLAILFILIGWAINSLGMFVVDSPIPTLTPTEPGSKVEVQTYIPPLIVDEYGVSMVLIPAGPFKMGSDSETAFQECQKTREDCERIWFPDEEPINLVILDNYYIDQFEVTNARYAECVNAGYCNMPSSSSSYSREKYFRNNEYDDYPVVNVSWFDAQDYCEWRGGYLPSEAKWEKAARGGLEGKLYPWGDEPPTCKIGSSNGAKFNDDADCHYTDTERVGLYGANEYGLYDVAGNVWEWVDEWYDVYPGGDPTFSDSFGEEARVLRGGSWENDEDFLRVANRHYQNPESTYPHLGFRCARSVASP